MDFSAFDKTVQEAYAAKAKAQWGSTAPYREYAQKSGGRTQDEEQTLADGMMELFASFGAARHLSPASPEAQALVRRLQAYITKHYYTCTDDILSQLGKMYESDSVFAANINKAGGEGTAQFAADAIEVYCAKRR